MKQVLLLMSKSLLKSAIDAVMPKGSIWTPKINGFFECLLIGLAESLEVVRLKLSELANIRNAKLTTVLDELERDYGVAFNPNLTEAERRNALDSRINATDNTGSRQELEKALQRAGFDLFVYSNSPAVDPTKFLDNYEMMAGEDNAFAGEPDAIAGVFLADLVVNGDIIFSTPVFALTAGDEFSFAGELTAIAEVEQLAEQKYEYFLPSNPTAWPFIFFVGGTATFAGDGSLLVLESVNIDDNRRIELREIILKYKPTFTWGMLKVNFI